MKNKQLGEAYRMRVGNFIQQMMKNPREINDELAVKLDRQVSFEKFDDGGSIMTTNNVGRRHKKHHSIFTLSNSQQKLLNNDTTKSNNQ